jgi:glutamyl-tRNA reductase
MQNTFQALILTYKTAPLAVREQVSLNEGEVKQLLNYVRDITDASDVLVISTCNRTEIYFSAEQDISRALFEGIRLIKRIDHGFEKHFQLLGHHDAVRHLFEVAIGLDAQVIGDLQISGQVKNAYQWSADEDMAGPFLHRIMHTIFFVNKRVVQETAFRDGAASTSYAAKELAEDLTAGLTEPKALVVGVGEIGRDVCLNLMNGRFKQVTIINRTQEKAEALARTCGFGFDVIENLRDAIQRADVVISSVSGSHPLITRELLKDLTILSHKFFIDLSIPRSVDPALETMPGVLIYNIDDLKEKTDEALEKRRASIPMVRAIIDQAIAEFEDWSKEMVVSPTIQKLKNALETIRKEELARFLKNADEKEAARMEELSKSLVQKFMKFPVLQLKAACRRGDAENLVEMLNDLFNLEKQPAKKS